VIGRIITCGHETYQMPDLLSWEVRRTGSVPCDSYSITCLYTAEMAPLLHQAVSCLLLAGEQLILHGIADEYVIDRSESGSVVTVSGRGYAARLLDNESRAATYSAATLADIIRNHVTPYGISCASCADTRASGVYTVASGSSQWKALEGFCLTYGGFSPRFAADGSLRASPPEAGNRFSIDAGTQLLSLSKRENHYGVLSEVLVIDKTQNVSYSVKNRDFLDRRGRCRRVLYTPGRSNWASMRYTGEYQIARSKADEISVTAVLPGTAAVSPGDTVYVDVEGISGTFHAASVEDAADGAGETTTLELKE